MLIAALWGAQVLAFIAGWAVPWRDAPEQQAEDRVARPIRMGLSLSLVLAALLIWGRSNGAAAVYSGWVALGMTASFVGDLIMARLIPLPNRLLGGMAAFGLAHALYITAYVQTVERGGGALPNIGLWLGLVVYGAGTVGGWWRFIRNPLKERALNLGALAYGVWISIMASFALGLATALGGPWWLAALGGLAFVASDFLIGITEIGGMRLRRANDWVWLTYLAGQMGIVYAGAF